MRRVAQNATAFAKTCVQLRAALHHCSVPLVGWATEATADSCVEPASTMNFKLTPVANIK
jgi:hypothetical protein